MNFIKLKNHNCGNNCDWRYVETYQHMNSSISQHFYHEKMIGGILHDKKIKNPLS